MIDRKRPTPTHFSGMQKLALRQDFALTPEQIEYLRRKLWDIKVDLTPSATTTDVRGALTALANELNRARKRVDRWTLRVRPNPEAEALGILNRAHRALVDIPDDGTWPAYINGLEAVRQAATLANAALALAPEGKRTGTHARRGAATSVPSSAAVIEWIVEALHRPDDDESRMVAARLRVTTSVRKKGGFAALAALVFEAALGVPEGQASPTNSIRAYQKLKAVKGEGIV